jgi:hypothetical protein
MATQPCSEHPDPAGASTPAAPRWIATPYSVFNLAQVCRIEYRRSDVSAAAINGFDLYLVYGAAVTLEPGDGRSSG